MPSGKRRAPADLDFSGDPTAEFPSVAPLDPIKRRSEEIEEGGRYSPPVRKILEFLQGNPEFQEEDKFPLGRYKLSETFRMDEKGRLRRQAKPNTKGPFGPGYGNPFVDYIHSLTLGEPTKDSIGAKGTFELLDELGAGIRTLDAPPPEASEAELRDLKKKVDLLMEEIRYRESIEDSRAVKEGVGGRPL